LHIQDARVWTGVDMTMTWTPVLHKRLILNRWVSAEELFSPSYGYMEGIIFFSIYWVPLMFQVSSLLLGRVVLILQ
jgi:hypothetical protein